VAIAVAWQTTATMTATTVNTFYTIPSSGAFGTYARDLAINNGGSATMLVSLTPSGAAGATSAASFAIPAGGTLLLTQCQVTAGAIIGVAVPTGTAIPSAGFCSNVSYV